LSDKKHQKKFLPSAAINRNLSVFIQVLIQKYNKAAMIRWQGLTNPKPPPAEEKEEPTTQPTQLGE
jgi:hypothetical protein